MELFDILGKNDNLKLQSLSMEELYFYKPYFDEYLLDYRNLINVNKNDHFGVEIEFENVDTEEIKEDFMYEKRDRNWELVPDYSLDDGGEIVSPILTDSNKCWSELKEMCQFIKKKGSIGPSSGAHIHVGAEILKNMDGFFNFLKIWSAYEHVIYHFLYGEYPCHRRELKEYATPVSALFWNNSNINKLDFSNLQKKFQGVSFLYTSDFQFFDKYNTIEFRSPNGTINPIVWQNNINFILKLLEYSSSSKFDLDSVEKKCIELSGKIKFIEYEHIYYQDVFELIDLVFNNNLDKIYFLKQYLKEYNDYNYKYQKVKNFTKYK